MQILLYLRPFSWLYKYDLKYKIKLNSIETLKIQKTISLKVFVCIVRINISWLNEIMWNHDRSGAFTLKYVDDVITPEK